jgi:predicted SAM-dependent methyltransferase
MKSFIQKLLRKSHLEALARELAYQLMLTTRGVQGVDRNILARYCQRYTVRKLHLGCGNYVLEGWLNSDLIPKSAGVMHLDATKPFPIDNNTFDYVFSQHMIEHVSYEEGYSMLRESYRILKEDGRIRISTPDIRFLIDLYRDDLSSLQRRYVEWSISRHIRHAPYNDRIFVVNNYFRDWGHKFIYDEESLRRSLEKAGFMRVVKCHLHESDESALRELEGQNSHDEFLKLETITLEGTKISRR